MTLCGALDSADYVRVINAFIVLYCVRQACALLLYSVRTQHLSRKITRIVVAFFVHLGVNIVRLCLHCQRPELDKTHLHMNELKLPWHATLQWRAFIYCKFGHSASGLPTLEWKSNKEEVTCILFVSLYASLVFHFYSFFSFLCFVCICVTVLSHLSCEGSQHWQVFVPVWQPASVIFEYFCHIVCLWGE